MIVGTVKLRPFYQRNVTSFVEQFRASSQPSVAAQLAD